MHAYYTMGSETKEDRRESDLFIQGKQSSLKIYSNLINQKSSDSLKSQITLVTSAVLKPKMIVSFKE